MSKLSKLQESIHNWYVENPGTTRKECAEAIFGNSDYFSMCSLAGAMGRLRKKGFLFFSTGINEEVIDLADESVPESKKMKVHKRINGLSIGVLTLNLEIIKAAKTPLLLETATAQLQQIDSLLVGARNYLYANITSTRKQLKARPKAAKTASLKR